jgi:hypothetical protein
MLRGMSRIACVIAVSLLAQGCSLIFVNGPPDGHERLRYFDCVSNGAGPAGDASWAIFDGLLAASVASVDDDSDSRSSAGTVAAVLGVAAAIHAGSLVYGLVQTNSCSDAKQHLQQRITDGDNEQRRRIEELERQLGAQQAPAVTAPAEPRTLELAPAPEPQPAATTAPPVTTTEVPPPPGAYTQPAPAQPAPAQPAPARPAPVQPAPARPAPK